MLKGADPLLDDGVITTVKTWRYRPLHGERRRPVLLLRMFEFKPQEKPPNRQTETKTPWISRWLDCGTRWGRRPRRRRRAGRDVAVFAGDHRRAAADVLAQPQLSRLYIAPLAPMVEGAGRLRDAVGLDERFAGSPVASVIGAG